MEIQFRFVAFSRLVLHQYCLRVKYYQIFHMISQMIVLLRRFNPLRINLEPLHVPQQLKA